MKAADCKVELLHPRPTLLLFLHDNEDTDQGQEEGMLVDKSATADTFMVDDHAFVMLRLFPRLVYH